MEINLLEIVEKGEIKATGAKPKLPTTIPNLNDNMLEVYRIPLKYLYYNDANGRISTQIKRDYGTLIPHNDVDGTDYNDKIAEFIEADNGSALRKTKKSIKEKGQQVYGYVLNDGRIVDGNRRYTALRQLQKDEGVNQFFEAVILPFTYDAKADRSQIKKLELSIQLGVEEKIQYDPVDLSVDIYKTVAKDGLLSAKEYSIEADIKVKEVNDRIDTVELMHEFLDFINAPKEAYYIIKDSNLYNPLYELAKKFKKIYPGKGPKYEESKETAFVMLARLIQTGGDTVREFRPYIQNILTTNANEEINAELEDTIEDFRDKLDEQPIQSSSDLKKRLDDAVPELRKVTESYNSISNRQNREKNTDEFISQIAQMNNSIQDIKEKNGLTGNLRFDNFTEEQLDEVRKVLIKMHIATEYLIEVYGNELQAKTDK